MVIIVSPDVRLEEDLVKYRLDNVSCYIESHCLNDGTFYIYLDRVVWINNDTTKDSFSIHFENLSFFAICRDLVYYDRPCVMLVSAGEYEVINRFLPRERPPDYEEADDENTITIRLLPINQDDFEEIYRNLREIHRENVNLNLSDNQNNESFFLFGNGNVNEDNEGDIFYGDEEPDQFEDASDDVEIGEALQEARERAIYQEMELVQEDIIDNVIHQESKKSDENGNR